MKIYHRTLFTDALTNAFSADQFAQTRVGAHLDGSPIPIVGQGDRIVLFQILEGDNWTHAFSESIILADAFTASNYGLPPNAKELGVFFVDLEGRRDRLDEKITADSTERFPVIEQGIPIRAFANSLKANGVSFVVGINDHSSAIHTIFENAGIIHVPLSTEAVFINTLIRDRYLIPEDAQNIVLGTTDIGGLKEASVAKQYLDSLFSQDTPIAVVNKYHVPTGVDFITDKVSEFIYGDVQGKFVIIIDDRSDSVSSILNAVDLYKQQGASKIGIYITHPVFADPIYFNNMKRLLADEKIPFI